MFYNHELLTNRQHGVATIWLVATLGSRSNLRTVSRKAIAEIDIASACKAITNPEAPLALRLQASLLYGVSRVHAHQCGYMLNDLYHFKDKLSESARPGARTEIDSHIGSVRPEHLNLPEDPLFMPELDLNFDLSAFDGPAPEPQGFPSTPQHHGERASGSPMLLPSLRRARPGLSRAPSSAAAEHVATGLAEAGGSYVIEEESPIIDDPGFEIAEDGSIVPLLLAPPPPPPPAYDHESGYGHPGAVLSAGSTSRQGDDNTQALVRDGYNDEGDMLLEDFDPLLPAARPFSPLLAAPGQQQTDPSFAQGATSATTTTTTTIITANAPQRRVRKSRPLQVDAQAELTNSELQQWDGNYLARMASVTRHKEHSGSAAQARKSAAFWIKDQGIGGVAMLFGQDRTEHPLAVFSGKSLLDALRGSDPLVPSPSPSQSQPGSKRRRSGSHAANDGDRGEDEESQGGRHVRAKVAGESGDDDDDDDYDGVVPIEDDVRIESERGRHVQSSLPDRPSGVMPWSMSGSRKSSAAGRRHLFGSVGAHRRHHTASAGEVTGAGMLMQQAAFSRRGSRITSASPLLGKGRGDARLPSLDIQHPVDSSMDLGLGSEVENFNPDDLGGLQFASDEVDAGGDEGGELHARYGPSQTVTTTMEAETVDFLAFVETGIAEGGLDDDEEEEHGITLDELLPPRENSSVVGAQALLHVLTLATAGLIDVQQTEPWAAIRLWLVGDAE